MQNPVYYFFSLITGVIKYREESDYEDTAKDTYKIERNISNTAPAMGTCGMCYPISLK